MEEFVVGLALILIGFAISLIIIGFASVTIATATFWYWLPAMIGTFLGVLIMTGGDFDFNPFD